MRKICCMALVALSLLAACKGKETEAGEMRQVTARPATPPPTGAAENDTALTQTVEIGDQRSSEEGGILTSGQSTATTGVAPAATASTPPVPVTTATH
jgi:hypothetical protein